MPDPRPPRAGDDAPGAEGPPAARPPTVPLGVRVPVALADRLDRLAETLSTPWHKLTRSEVIRVVLERGIESAEEEANARRRDEGG
jgi:predicted DNA-binding protein